MGQLTFTLSLTSMIACANYYLSLGETYKLAERSFTHIYKYMEENPTGPKRKHKDTIKHMEEAVSSDSTVSPVTKVMDNNFMM